MLDGDAFPGAVKITPGHDPNDYEVGMRLKLPFLTIITNEGNITKDCGEFAVSGFNTVRTGKLQNEGLPLFRNSLSLTDLSPPSD